MTRNPFAGMRDAKPTGGGNYLPPNFRGEVQIDQCILNSGFKQDTAFIAELTVLSSNLPTIEPGMSKSWYQGKLDDPQMAQTAVGEVAGFVAAALGVNVQDANMRDEIGARMLTITGPTNPLAGMRVLVETWLKMSRRGTEFTKHRFTAVEGAPGCIPATIPMYLEPPPQQYPPQGYAPQPARAPYAPPAAAPVQYPPQGYAPQPARAPYAPPAAAPVQYAPQQAKPVWDAAAGQWRMP